MSSYICVSLGTASVAAILTFGVWRLASKRHSLPCPVWLRWFVELDNPFTKTNRAAVIVALLDVKPGMQVLDLGCGPGRLTLPLARAAGPNGAVTAVDIQEGMLRRAREKAQAAGLANIEFRQLDACRGGLEPGFFDRAVMVTVLGEIPGREAVFREMARVLKPGGVLSVTEVIFDPHFQSQSAVRGWARSAGFVEKAVFGHRLAYTMHLMRD